MLVLKCRFGELMNMSSSGVLSCLNMLCMLGVDDRQMRI
jgi:hypothetical protein